MTLGLTDTSPGPAGEVTRDTTWPRRCHVSRSRVTCHACHGPRDARLGDSSGRGICIRWGLVLADSAPPTCVLQCCSAAVSPAWLRTADCLRSWTRRSYTAAAAGQLQRR